MHIIDTHVHLIGPKMFTYSWLADTSPLKKQWSAEHYFQKAIACGIKSAIHVEANVAISEIEAEAKFTTKADDRLTGVVASCRPEDANFDQFLERITRIPKIVGLRRVLHNVSEELCQTTQFSDNLRKLTRLGLTFDLIVRAPQLTTAAALVDRAPNVQFVLNHCGSPNFDEQNLKAWRDDITSLAKRPNLAVKISGLVSKAGPDWSIDKIQPYMEHAIEAFGWDRVVWGSDFPLCTKTASLESWVQATRAIISTSSPTEQAKFLHRNAMLIYGIVHNT